MRKIPIIVICGPTATGKSDYAVSLAKEKNGEVISADSRQVYKGLDIGSGKITKKEMRGVPHHILSIADPKRTYSVARFQTDAARAIRAITRRGKVPIICGGTGFYIDALVYGTTLPAVPPQPSFRKKLARYSTETLAAMVQDQDPHRFETIDPHNRVRLIRALEIINALGAVPPIKNTPRYDVSWVYLDFPTEELIHRITVRLKKRIRQGMIAEVRRLHESQKLSWKRLESFGLEYRAVARYLQGFISKQEMQETLLRDIIRYAKRQRTWFKKYAR